MTFKRFLLFLAALLLLLLGWSYWSAIADPVVREARVELPGFPAGEAPVRVALLADIHVQGPDMPPEPLAGLRSRFGTIAVLGEHDHGRNGREARDALTGIGVRVLANQAVQAGPLVIGGLDDQRTGRNRDQQTYGAMRTLPGARVLLSHSPDPFATLPPDIGLMLAGHNHCGQIRLPLYGALTTDSAYGERYACGFLEQNGRKLIVTAGLGASMLPLRLGAAPDIWLVTVAPRGRR